MSKTKYSKELLEPLVQKNSSIAGVMRDLGLRITGGSHFHLAKKIKVYGLDTSHFKGCGSNKGKTFPNLRLTPETILVYDRNNTRREEASKLRRAMIEAGVEYKCDLCPIVDDWNGRKIVLEVDHIDGDNVNNVLTNLRFLCPNCHQQETYK